MTEGRIEDRVLSRAGSWLAALALLLGAQACFKARPYTGGESHFLRGCDASCGVGLSCICGVCTQSCKASSGCGALADGATCVAPSGKMASCDAAPALACDMACDKISQCTALGPNLECVSGRCRERTVAAVTMSQSSTVAMSQTAAAPQGGGASSCPDGGCPLAEQPLVVLVVDTSGSMEEKTSCTCTSPGCIECRPDCTGGERSRWIDMLEVLTGTYQNYACQELDRTAANGATFDLGYFFPHYAPQGDQTDDGLLDLYRDRLRFGIATFDGWDTYVGAPPLVAAADFDFERSAGVDGLWSYNPERVLGASLRRSDGARVGEFVYPNEVATYYLDTGVRGPQAAQGALLIATDTASAADVNDRIQLELRAVWPYGGTPMAGALDDLHYYLSADPAMQRERANTAPRHVVLITDGYPDADYRDYGCDCATTQDPTSADYCGGPTNDPSAMHCPYPTPEDAASALRCGVGMSCDGSEAVHLHVVAYAVTDATVMRRLDAIASAGGGGSARIAADGPGLTAQLGSLLEEIAAGH